MSEFRVDRDDCIAYHQANGTEVGLRPHSLHEPSAPWYVVESVGPLAAGRVLADDTDPCFAKYRREDFKRGRTESHDEPLFAAREFFAEVVELIEAGG